MRISSLKPSGALYVGAKLDSIYTYYLRTFLSRISTSKRRSPCFFKKVHTEDELAGTKFQRQHSQTLKIEASISNSRIGIQERFVRATIEVGKTVEPLTEVPSR